MPYFFKCPRCHQELKDPKNGEMCIGCHRGIGIIIGFFLGMAISAAGVVVASLSLR